MSNSLRHIVHPFKPVIDENCRILILGSIPSIVSQKQGFFYMHPSNRFWRITGKFCGVDLTLADEHQKRNVLLSKNIALYDAVCECDILGSLDSSVKNIVPTDVAALISGSKIQKILCNGATAYKTAAENNPSVKLPFIKLPSTSPRNAGMQTDWLELIWLNELGKQ